MKHLFSKIVSHLRKNLFCYTIIGIIFVIFLAVLNVHLIISAISTAADATTNAFKTAKDQEQNSVISDLESKGFQRGEADHHVSNKVAISIDKVQEKADLEVLSVSAVGYSVHDKDPVSWLRVTETGIFTVNLQAGEYLVDNERQYVQVRVPKPALSHFSSKEKELLLFKDGQFLNGTFSDGTSLAQEQMKEAVADARKSITLNEEFCRAAESFAEAMIISLVRSANPDVAQLKVDVEFID